MANEYRDCANEIHSSGNHLLNQINDILDFSRIESGSEVIVEDEIDLHELARSVSQQFVTTASKAGVTLQMDLPSSLPPLFSDTDKVKKVLVHLLGNAVKFTPQGGRVTLSVRSETNGDCLFEVIDSGIGMSAEDQEKALGLFNQVDVTLSRRSDGSGLGLPLSKSIVELLGGSLQLHSSAGAGTTVTVHLPSRPVTAKIGSLRAANRGGLTCKLRLAGYATLATASSGLLLSRKELVDFVLRNRLILELRPLEFDIAVEHRVHLGHAAA